MGCKNGLGWNEVAAIAPMAKMRYSEMPRDVSSESLSALRISEDSRQDKSPGSEVDASAVLFSGNGCPLLSHGVEKSVPSSGNLQRKLSVQPFGQNRDSQGAGLQSKSHSLPSGVSPRGPAPVGLDPLRVSPEDYASQLTLLDLLVFRAILPDELASCGWNKRNKLAVAPNVVAFTRRFNHVSFWVVQEVLKGASLKQRAEILAHFVRVAKKLYDLNNLHSLFAVVSALQSASVYRLSKTWGSLPRKEKQTFDKLAELFSDADNRSKLREHMDSLRLPCIPYLGLFLTDLTYIDVAHPHSGGLESEQRRLKMNNVLRVIAHYQQSDYSHLAPLPAVQAYLRSVRYIDELQKFVEDDQYKLSLLLEPPSPAHSSSSSKESVSDAAISSLGLSPAKGPAASAKFLPSHRKCRSLGTKFRSTSLPRNFHKAGQHYQVGCALAWVPAPAGIFSKPTVAPLPCDDGKPLHLLDDSVLEEPALTPAPAPAPTMCLEAAPSTPADDEDRILLAPHGSLEWDDASGAGFQMQGCLRRKTVLKDGRKPAVSAWQRYWVQLWASHLVYFCPKSFKGNERDDFKREPHKMVSVLGWCVQAADSSLQPDLFHLADARGGCMYKFRAGSKGSAQRWCRRLEQATRGSEDKPRPQNLMTFD
ncbi:ras-specific guanine nucleotide-releasing factor RalGPS2-like isoform X2 [Bacillus rossius redtenbacheri]|uniref:ras-specific guanine nucleotide-releasing factor RalGPS2-like isoform X2 n=1 Tax=Bacillus rossius redtenbacheri TaxID=93214 RepID=UPI002FDD135A